jgi:transcriptional regulator with XRE-family HTH domain
MKLREARLARYLSIRELGKRADVAPRTIVEAESGRRVPYFVTARKIAEALGVEPGDIEEFAIRADEDFEGKDAA